MKTIPLPTSCTHRSVGRCALVFVSVAISCFGFVPGAPCVLPAPDGGYPGGNTAEGQSALLSLTTGGFNTAVGYFSLRSDRTGSLNTAIGAGALLANTGGPTSGEGDENTAIGAGALLNNAGGFQNTAAGAFALFSNILGYGNTAVGLQALFSNTSGITNTAIGEAALNSNTNGSYNTANGSGALLSNTIGSTNTATGNAALFSNSEGNSNTATGGGALFLNTTGSENTATGAGALHTNNIGFLNTADGSSALSNNGSGHNNTAIGQSALVSNTSGSFNVAVGDSAGSNLTTGDGNIDILNPGIADESETIRIGVQNVQTRTLIAGIFGTNVSGSTVVVDSDGQLGVAASSRRYKREIKPMDKGSESVLALKPVTFQYKDDKTATPQFGLIAEDVAEVNPNLVVRDKDGQIYTVRYEALNAMLLNEFLKEHRRVEEQRAAITQLREDFRATVAVLTERLKEQDAKIGKVSAQVEMNRAAPQMIVDRQ
jgi:hypothetical protein